MIVACWRSVCACVRRRKREVRRARIVLLAAEGLSTQQVGRVVGVDEKTVVRRRERFAIGGLSVWSIVPGRGGHRFTGRRRDCGSWRLRPVSRRMGGRCRYRPHTSAALRKNYGSSGLVNQPFTRCGFTSNAARIRPTWEVETPTSAIRSARRSEGATSSRAGPIVLSVDEKTAMAAQSRKHPDQPAAAGRAKRREFEYVRHGTVSITAALDVHTGQALIEELPRNDSAHFIAFLRRLDRHIPPQRVVHLVLDNGASHVSRATRAWLAEHPRFVAHYTRRHASWLNQVEFFFSLLGRRVLRHGDFPSRSDLPGKLVDFTIAHNERAVPFRWSYDGESPAH